MECDHLAVEGIHHNCDCHPLSLGSTPTKAPESTMEERFEKQFCTTKICKGCLRTDCDYSTTGCPWYQNGYFLDEDIKDFSTQENLKKFIRTEINQALDALARTDALREKKGAHIGECPCSDCWENGGYNACRSAVLEAIGKAKV